MEALRKQKSTLHYWLASLTCLILMRVTEYYTTPLFLWNPFSCGLWNEQSHRLKKSCRWPLPQLPGDLHRKDRWKINVWNSFFSCPARAGNLAAAPSCARVTFSGDICHEEPASSRNDPYSISQQAPGYTIVQRYQIPAKCADNSRKGLGHDRSVYWDPCRNCNYLPLPQFSPLVDLIYTRTLHPKKSYLTGTQE